MLYNSLIHKTKTDGITRKNWQIHRVNILLCVTDKVAKKLIKI